MTDCFYHYTDAETALKILTKKELWMTHISYLNDTQEGKDLREHLNPKVNNPEIHKILDYIDSHYESYVCSLSKNGDLLSQWRGYCPKGEGYAIGFRQPNFENKEREACFRGEAESNNDAAHAAIQVSEYHRCIYGEEEKESIIEELAEAFEADYKEMPNDIKSIVSQLPKAPLNWKALNGHLNNGLWLKYYSYFKLIFKDETFKEEEEYRLFIIFHNQYKQTPCYRVKKGVFIPYHRFCFNDDIFKEIIVRKTPNEKLSHEGLSHYLKHNKGMTEEKIKDFIKISNIPYRE
ncbi:DUF2971 domain-containing protein [Thalassotalea profundi]|uniref:DUF2971 domain-containing protein n=1 Tax=Thalassotalea profundi TaxID=2036687 RepID=A0ABQ3J8F0_9GAMM|nr:DUF2971 domain-containing protein [Thalassotalea profundi]GHF02451.1 hypothetical protein GCM10011501_34770 [Thalassotalea profundi]